jgi:hypothetical protein
MKISDAFAAVIAAAFALGVLACFPLREPTEAETVRALQAACLAAPTDPSEEVRDLCRRLAAIDSAKLEGP